MTARTGRRNDIQGLRGLAVLLVVVYHAGLRVPGGFTGVDVFFVISGYVITRSLLPELVAEGRIHLRRFYGRRVRRLLPALAVVLVFVALAGTLASPIEAQRTGMLTGLWASVFSANVFLYRVGTGYFDVGAGLDPLLHTWTLAVEEQFYLIFPVLLALSWRFGRRRAVVVSFAVASTASFAAAVSLGGNGVTAASRFAFYSSPTRAWEFGAGAMLAIFSFQLRRIMAEVLAAAGVAAILVGAFVIHGTSGFPGLVTLLPVWGACAVIVAGSFGSAAACRALGSLPLRRLGDLSYSWYLWHWPLIVFARAFWPHAGAIAAVVSLVPAWASYRFVENPIRFSPRARRAAVIAVICIALPIVANLGGLVVQRHLQHTAAFARWEQANRLHEDVARGCENPIPIGERIGARWSSCTWPVRESRGLVYLLGDSNGGQFTEPFVAAAKRDNYEAVLASVAGCPFLDVRVFGTTVGNDECRRFVTESTRALIRLRPKLIVIANRGDGFIEVGSKGLALPGESVTHDSDAKAVVWQQGLARTLDLFAQAGIPVVVVQPVPLLDSLHAGCAVIRILRNGCRASMTRSVVDAELRRTAAANEAAAATAPTASLADFTDVFCTRQRCSSVVGSTIAYRDRDHLSVDGALLLTKRFRQLIAVRADGVKPRS